MLLLKVTHSLKELYDLFHLVNVKPVAVERLIYAPEFPLTVISGPLYTTNINNALTFMYVPARLTTYLVGT
ncbi:hypothetical protein D3C79_1057720 [compost metagenome]